MTDNLVNSENVIINEWQLNSQLSKALLDKQGEKFHLYLSMMSNYLLDHAKFQTPLSDNASSQENSILAEQLGVKPSVVLECNKTQFEIENRAQFLASSQAALSLNLAIHAPAIALYNDPKRLSSEVWESLSLHSRRHCNQSSVSRMEPHENDLVDLLDNLNQSELGNDEKPFNRSVS